MVIKPDSDDRTTWAHLSTRAHWLSESSGWLLHPQEGGPVATVMRLEKTPLSHQQQCHKKWRLFMEHLPGNRPWVRFTTNVTSFMSHNSVGLVHWLFPFYWWGKEVASKVTWPYKNIRGWAKFQATICLTPKSMHESTTGWWVRGKLKSRKTDNSEFWIAGKGISHLAFSKSWELSCNIQSNFVSELWQEWHKTTITGQVWKKMRMIDFSELFIFTQR